MAKSIFLQTALEAVKKAEKIIMKHYVNDVSHSLKPDHSPVTEADIESEKIIIGTIKNKFSDHAFLGEESGSDVDDAEYTWIIDPIDGTKNYVRQIPFFGTQLALMKSGKLILGVSNLPLLKELMYAEKGTGAFFNGKQIHVSKVDDIENAYMSFGSLRGFRPINQLNNLASLAASVQSCRGIGDCWSYHLLAQGKIDIMVEGKIKIWDIAALTVIIEEAGGEVSDINGNPISKDTTTIIASNNQLHNKIVEHFKTSTS